MVRITNGRQTGYTTSEHFELIERFQSTVLKHRELADGKQSLMQFNLIVGGLPVAGEEVEYMRCIAWAPIEGDETKLPKWSRA
jgi:hypothetical protein